jgi:hypothetical protein
VLSFCGCPEGEATPKDRIAGMSDQESCEENARRVNDFPGLRLPCASVAVCRDIDCVRAAGVKCGAIR